mmetsp:Transcript_16137/g.50040  ORF Transcript_16137/g.50040 Transcript_16137/m.50040 type:complete len:214 (+) Transcript_16137:1082-1723(+)
MNHRRWGRSVASVCDVGRGERRRTPGRRWLSRIARTHRLLRQRRLCPLARHDGRRGVVDRHHDVRVQRARHVRGRLGLRASHRAVRRRPIAVDTLGGAPRGRRRRRGRVAVGVRGRSGGRQRPRRRAEARAAKRPRAGEKAPSAGAVDTCTQHVPGGSATPRTAVTPREGRLAGRVGAEGAAAGGAGGAHALEDALGADVLLPEPEPEQLAEV